MERLTVSLTQRASNSLKTVSALTHDNKTDVINRALSVYAYIQLALANGGRILVQHDQDSEPVEIVIF